MKLQLSRTIVFILGLLFLSSSSAKAQFDDIYIFGFSQTIFNSKSIKYSILPRPDLGIPIGLDNAFETNSFALHQTNLFLQKHIDEKFSFFMNFEFTGSYSTQFNSGNFNVQEGWINYHHSDGLSAKVGLLLPTFNNLNEIQNRLPLFPYLIRPVVYETLLNGLFAAEDYIPERAFIQLYGYQTLGRTYLFDYAFFVGNSERSYLSQIDPGIGATTEAQSGTVWRGENLTKMLSYGTRLGIRDRKESIKFGLSFTFDHDNRQQESDFSLSRLPWQVLPVFGDVPRFRIGNDFSFTWHKLSFEHELIYVMHDHSEIYKVPQYKAAGVNLNKFFSYQMASWNFSDKLYTFGGNYFLKDNSFNFIQADAPDGAGLYFITYGGGWKPNDSIAFKLQVVHAPLGENSHIKWNIRFITLGASVIF